MTPWFVLSYPRSRTAWLATYLTGGGVFAFHEAWKLVQTPKQLRRVMESKSHDGGPVVNVDCSNWFFLDELMAEFPTAKFLRIERPWRAVEADARASFGEQDYPAIQRAYQRAIERSTLVPDLTIAFDYWTPDMSVMIWQAMTDRPLDRDWHRQMHDLFIQLTPAAIQTELMMGARGELLHITRRMVG